MVLVVYRRKDGTYLLMPTDSLARKHVREMHAPLVLCTHVTLDDLEDNALRERVLADISDHSYSMINETIARHFVGLTCDPVHEPTGRDPLPVAA